MTNTIRNRVLAFSSLLAATALLFFTAGEAVTQIRAALVKNTDEPGRLPYQHRVDFPNANCNTTTCVLPFPAVPAGKRLVIQHVSIIASASTNTPPNWVAFGEASSPNVAAPNTENIAIVQPFFTQGPSQGGVSFWALDREVLVYYDPGAIPKLKISVPTSFSTFVSNATVHGYLIDATN